MPNSTNLPSSVMRAFRRVKGEPSAMGLEARCSRLECSAPAVTSLEDRDFCFDHFCSRCYELLERSGRGVEQAISSQAWRDELLAIDECATRALEISFSRVPLHNLDRARLLDILLWAGDLTTTMRHRRTAPPELVCAENKAIRNH